MAMKKTFGGDSPLWQCARKSFWTLPILGRRRRRIAMCFWKSDRVFRFFPSGGLYRRRGGVRGGPGWSHHQGRRPALDRAALWCGRPVAPLCLLFGLLEAPLNIWTSGFCFVQFREYFLCNILNHKNSKKQGTGTVASR
jgi:hypothetical protein